ncbi:DUF4422 domain-containing protein [uncultured Eubacterium sp.]|uniref:DUF4422 domain-containing protein n=1 Tax=uncultured Eubacterium sp. TaxID=165185 RepID=UPI0025EAA3BF|nr:DUF4422 domain-containing protein [uncultured Eubacterium sp.]
MSKKNIKIIVAAHKRYWMPSDEMYLPIHVGHAIAKEDIGYQGDDTGENISEKNANYCELTGIYWAWKNLDADYIGLVHYRRYLSNRNSGFPVWFKDKKESVLTWKKANHILEHYDVIVPKKRNYYIETLYKHYEHTHDHKHLDITGEIIQSLYPAYEETFTRMLQRKSGHMFNMFIMKKELYHAYCEWLFPVLQQVEKKIDTSKMTPYEARFMGRISELLLDVWLEHNHIVYKELPWVQLGKENWPKKIRYFLAAKFKNRKYGQSF